MSDVERARNIHRAYVIEETSNNMSSDIVSDMIDFREMTVGSIQAKWSGNDAADGLLVVYASNIPDDEWFAKINCGEHTMSGDGTAGNEKTAIFNLGSIGYRYMRVKYFQNSNTQGDLVVIGLGKKNG